MFGGTLRLSALISTVVISAIAGSASVSAQSYPAQPVKIVVGFGPGSAADILARVVGRQMETTLGQPMVIENRPGNSSMIAADSVARATARHRRWLHAVHGDDRQYAQPGGDQVEFQSRQGYGADHASRRGSERAGRAPIGAGQQPGGIDRAGEEQAGNPDIRLIRLCHRKLYGCRA